LVASSLGLRDLIAGGASSTDASFLVAVASDTSPLSYLILIGKVEVLFGLYGEILIPPAVEKELRSPDGPGPPRRWIEEAPSRLRVKQPPGESPKDLSPDVEERFRSLDRGERQAIGLAQTADSELLIIDERDGRTVAKEMGLRITGTLGVLDEAASEGKVDPQRVVDQLRDTSFRASGELYRWLIERHS
jgi:predicted nucleic acid-binding protein